MYRVIILLILDANDKYFFPFFVFISIFFTFGAIDLWIDMNSNDVSNGEFIRALFVYLLITGFGFSLAFFGLRRARLIEDVPTAKIRSAHQGYVELEGKAKRLPENQLISPLTKQECCWYDYSINTTGRDSSIVDSGNSYEIPFLLQDETGTCLIEPEGAEIITLHKKKWRGKKKHPDDIEETDISYTYSESVLLENDLLYAVGHFQTLDGLKRNKMEAQLTREILKDWKGNQETLLQQFDDNKDGQIELSEWEKAKRLAANEASEKVTKMMNNYPHRLSYPKLKQRGHQYLISNKPQSELVDYYRQRAKIGLFFFLHCCLLTGIIFAKYTL
jgi:hypothetical protein